MKPSPDSKFFRGLANALLIELFFLSAIFVGWVLYGVFS